MSHTFRPFVLMATCLSVTAAATLFTPAFAGAQNPEIKFKDYRDGYTNYYYPEVCTFKIVTPSQPAGPYHGSIDGKVSISCPAGQSFKTYSFAYGSGKASGEATDNMTETNHKADGTENIRTVKFTPGACTISTVSCVGEAWVNVKIVPNY